MTVGICNVCGERAMYNRCEEHYRCDVCGTHDRATLCHREGGVTCDACHAEKVAERMKQKHDTQYTDELRCPYCGYTWTDSWELGNSGEFPCPDCDNTFEFEKEVSVSYISWKKGG